MVTSIGSVKAIDASRKCAQQQKLIAQRIVTFQAQISALQASSAQQGSATAAINSAANPGYAREQARACA